MTVETYAPGPLAERSPQTRAGDLVSWAQAASAAHALAESITRTAFVPEAFKGKPDDAAVAILMGAEVGLSPLQALASLYVVKGRPGMYARAQVALVQSRGHQVWTEKSGAAEVVVCGQRAGSEHVERVSWTISRAQTAGLTRQNQGPWRDHPEAMLWARAASDICRRIASDVLLGIPEDVTEPGPSVDETGADVAPVQRRSPVSPPPLAAPPDYVPPVVDMRVDPGVVIVDQVRQMAGRRSGKTPLAPPEPEPEPVAPEAADDEPPNDDAEPTITKAQSARLHAEFRGVGMGRDEYLAWAARVLEVEHLETLAGLTVTEASALLDRIETIKATRRANEPTPEPGATVTDEDMREDRAADYRTE